MGSASSKVTSNSAATNNRQAAPSQPAEASHQDKKVQSVYRESTPIPPSHQVKISEPTDVEGEEDQNPSTSVERKMGKSKKQFHVVASTDGTGFKREKVSTPPPATTGQAQLLDLEGVPAITSENVSFGGSSHSTKLESQRSGSVTPECQQSGLVTPESERSGSLTPKRVSSDDLWTAPTSSESRGWSPEAIAGSAD